MVAWKFAMDWFGLLSKKKRADGFPSARLRVVAYRGLGACVDVGACIRGRRAAVRRRRATVHQVRARRGEAERRALSLRALGVLGANRASRGAVQEADLAAIIQHDVADGLRRARRGVRALLVGRAGREADATDVA